MTETIRPRPRRLRIGFRIPFLHDNICRHLCLKSHIPNKLKFVHVGDLRRPGSRQASALEMKRVFPD